jgi:hypothetical protein
MNAVLRSRVSPSVVQILVTSLGPGDAPQGAGVLQRNLVVGNCVRLQLFAPSVDRVGLRQVHRDRQSVLRGRLGGLQRQLVDRRQIWTAHQAAKRAMQQRVGILVGEPGQTLHFERARKDRPLVAV